MKRNSNLGIKNFKSRYNFKNNDYSLENYKNYENNNYNNYAQEEINYGITPKIDFFKKKI